VSEGSWWKGEVEIDTELEKEDVVSDGVVMGQIRR
jgi:hypothetical protein